MWKSPRFQKFSVPGATDRVLAVNWDVHAASRCFLYHKEKARSLNGTLNKGAQPSFGEVLTRLLSPCVKARNTERRPPRRGSSPPGNQLGEVPGRDARHAARRSPQPAFPSRQLPARAGAPTHAPAPPPPRRGARQRGAAGGGGTGENGSPPPAPAPKGGLGAGSRTPSPAAVTGSARAAAAPRPQPRPSPRPQPLTPPSGSRRRFGIFARSVPPPAGGARAPWTAGRGGAGGGGALRRLAAAEAAVGRSRVPGGGREAGDAALSPSAGGSHAFSVPSQTRVPSVS